MCLGAERPGLDALSLESAWYFASPVESNNPLAAPVSTQTMAGMEKSEWWQSPVVPAAFCGAVLLTLGFAFCGGRNTAPSAEAVPTRAAMKPAVPCPRAEGIVPQYVKREAERDDYANVPRLSWRVVVPVGLSREELTANLCLAAIDAHRSANVKLGSVMIFAYSSQETSGAYSAGRAVYAPQGDWAKADPDTAMFEWRVSTDLAEGYFAPKPVLLGAGDQVELITDNGLPIGISRSPTSWGDADFVARAPKGTKARIVSMKTSNLVDGHTMTRYEIATVGGARGWVHSYAVSPIMRKP